MRQFGDGAKSWHHYAEAWDAVSGARSIWVDGVRTYSDNIAAGSTWLDQQAFIVFGMACYADGWLQATHTGCAKDFRMHGAIDDVTFTPTQFTPTQTHGVGLSCDELSRCTCLWWQVAVWAGVLSDAQVVVAASGSLTNRITAGLEDNLVLFWNFNDPLTSPGEVANLGTAGTDYDLILGRLPKPTAYVMFEDKFSDMVGDAQDLFAPTITASTDPSGTRYSWLSNTIPACLLSQSAV